MQSVVQMRHLRREQTRTHMRAHLLPLLTTILAARELQGRNARPATAPAVRAAAVPAPATEACQLVTFHARTCELPVRH